MQPNDHPLGRVLLDLEGPILSAAERDLLQHPALGGLILFARNYQSLPQLQELLAAVRECNARLLVTVDQEGGRVQRLVEGFTRLPPLHDFAAAYARDPTAACALATEGGWLMAAEVLAAGCDLSFAPVLDVFSSSSRVIADRAFAGDIETVTALALAYIRGMHEAGMAATGKHFPGHGSVLADSHVELPVDTRSAEAILGHDYQVFARCCAELDAIMPAHVIYPAVDSVCAGFSTYWLQERLRGELGFDGVIFSDDLVMAAAQSVGSIEERLEQSFAAGCDVALVCNDRRAALAALAWVEREGLGGCERLPRLQGGGTLDFAALRRQPRWEEARARLAHLNSTRTHTAGTRTESKHGIPE